MSFLAFTVTVDVNAMIIIPWIRLSRLLVDLNIELIP